MLKKRVNIHIIWLAMMTLTLFTYALGKLDFSGVAVVFVLLLTVIIKGSFIIRDYMELRDVSLIWRVIMYGWLWSTTVAIGLIYIISLR
jgi:hypothetical protein